jgi:hypothetical protein
MRNVAGQFHKLPSSEDCRQMVARDLKHKQSPDEEEDDEDETDEDE